MAHQPFNQSGPFILMELPFDWLPLNDWVSNYQPREEIKYNTVLLFLINHIPICERVIMYSW